MRLSFVPRAAASSRCARASRGPHGRLRTVAVDSTVTSVRKGRRRPQKHPGSLGPKSAPATPTVSFIVRGYLVLVPSTGYDDGGAEPLWMACYSTVPSSTR